MSEQAGAVGAGVVGDGLTAAGKYAYRRLRLFGKFEVEWLVRGGDLELTGREAEDLDDFLRERTIKPIIALYASLILVEGSSEGDLQVPFDAFRSQALRWAVDRDAPWTSKLDEIWEQIGSILQGTLPPRTQFDENLRSEIRAHAGYVESQLATSGGAISALMDIMGDIDRLTAASVLAADVGDALSAQRLPPIVTHTHLERHADFETLYVDRTVLDRSSGRIVPADENAMAGRCFRAVLLGSPGAGKTTYVRHLTVRLARMEAGLQQPAIVVRCREYVASDWQSSIFEYLSGLLRRDFGITADSDLLTGAFLLGKFAVIFDGLDEIIDLDRRRDFVGRVQVFAADYPLIPILVTSRQVGYANAPLPETTFQHLSLREFDLSQIETYARNWFTAQSTPALAASFMHDSESVSDLRSNPLLLSLLCILYGARGAIPRRRREIYSRCADLLFHTWDSQRQIGQPEELPAYGDRLMEEIARWVYSSQKAQAGLEEQVIERVIAVRLTDLGLAEHEAKRRSREFLEFCAGRAWLLGSMGTTERGQRLFGFTHRTFFEYFTAEALSRQARDLKDICDHILTAHEADPSSVLPELLAQAYEERVADGARDAFKELCARSAPAALLLRLMNGSLLAQPVRRLGFATVLREYASDPSSLRTPAFAALLALDSNAFNQFVDDFSNDRDGRRLLVAACADLMFAGRLGEIPVDYHVPIDGAIDAAVAENDPILKQGPVRSMLYATGRAVPGPVDNMVMLVLDPFGVAPRLGAIFMLLAKYLAGETTPHDEEFLESWFQWLQAGSRVPKAIAVGTRDALLNSQATLAAIASAHASAPTDRAEHGDRYLALLVALLYEVDVFPAPTHAAALRRLLPDSRFQSVLEVRGWRTMGLGRPSRQSAERAKAMLSSSGLASAWCDGTFSLLSGE